MQKTKTRKIVIIGAGHVGSHCAMCLMLQNEVDELILIDKDKEKAAMHALDLDDMASSLSRNFTVRSGDYKDCKNADIVVMAAGKSREPGQTRLDMFEDSIHMIQEISKPLKASGFCGILISISNPADIIGDYLRKQLGLPRNQVFSTGTALDSARLRRMLSEILEVSRTSIQAYCMGEHGDSQMIPFSHITVYGLPLTEYLEKHPGKKKQLDFQTLCANVRMCGFHILDGKGCTEFGIGAVLCDFVRAVLHDEKRILPVSVFLEGEYGESGIPSGVPAVIGKHGVEHILEIQMTKEEEEAFHSSCKVIRGFVEKAEKM